MKSARLVLGIAFVFAALNVVQCQSVVGSQHDFSSTNAGAQVKSQNGTEVCIFCHTPHNATPSTPLWNHASSAFNYTQVYSSLTLRSTVGAPNKTDTSKLCLSCHDGTVALGDSVNNGNVPFANGVTTMPAGARANLGSNLETSHPFSFIPAVSTAPAYPQVVSPAANDAVKYDATGKVQCTTCHDPHDERKDTVEGRFLVKNNSGSSICLSCHLLQSTSGAPVPWSWNGSGQISAHSSKANTYDAVTNNPGGTESAFLGAHTGYTTTDTNGCAACHRPHTAHVAERLLKASTDQVCFQCHDGNAKTGLRDIKSAFARIATPPALLANHPGTGDSQLGHDPSETPMISGSRHATCDDCHNPHAAAASSSVPLAPAVSSALVGVSGVTAAGVPMDPRRGTGEAANQYEICLKCHGDSTNKPQNAGYSDYGRTPIRASYSGDNQTNFNLRLQFAGTVARHNVTQARTVDAVPSLRARMLNVDGATESDVAMNAGTFIYCTDCHAGEANRRFGGSSPNGPHGSAKGHLLERNYQINTLPVTPGLDFPPVTYTAGIAGPYALCDKCHDLQNKIMNDQSWPKHSLHVGGTTGASCAVCHASHGVQAGSAANARLVDFDTGIVGRNRVGDLKWDPASRTCSLTCHGKEHAGL